MDKNKIGRIGWMDLTVNDAETVSEFYSEVIGWKKEGLSMGDYNDYVMKDAANDEGITGVCHAKGVNNYLPPQWIIYIGVADLDASLATCKKLGGKIIGNKRTMGGKETYCLIQDPAGAYMMLYGD